MRTRLLAAAAALLAAAPAAAQDPDPRYAWVQAATGGAWSVRAVLDGSAASCPAGMHVRAFPSEAFPVLVCEVRVEAGVGRIEVAGRAFRLPVDSVRRVVVLGDTGCRINGTTVQDCADPVAWPFADVAARASAERPELVVHTGDYFYRESCPAAGCPPGPVGDVWAAWEADFFRPATPLLEAAPWVMARGNHELCGRGGEGWFRLLDPGERRAEGEAPCADFTPAYRAAVPGLELRVLDTACAPERARCTQPADGRVAEYARQLRAVAAMPGGGAAWLVTHSPLWSVTPPYGGDSLGTRVLQQALDSAGGLTPDVGAVMAGHVHFFESLSFGGARAPSFIVGHGGTSPDTANVVRPPGFPIDGVPLEEMAWRRGFGYVLATPDAGGWRLDVRMLVGDPIVCRLRDRRSLCTDD